MNVPLSVTRASCAEENISDAVEWSCHILKQVSVRQNFIQTITKKKIAFLALKWRIYHAGDI